MHPPTIIGPGTLADLRELPEVERRASALFRTIPETASLPEDVTPLHEFETAYGAGLLWVARSGCEPIGFALVERLGDGFHLEELNVSPDHGRKGVGRALVEAVCAHARRERRALSLCTFAAVPWNAPFYERVGFGAIAPGELWPELAQRVAEETARGLGAYRRVAMKFV